MFDHEVENGEAGLHHCGTVMAMLRGQHVTVVAGSVLFTANSTPSFTTAFLLINMRCPFTPLRFGSMSTLAH